MREFPEPVDVEYALRATGIQIEVPSGEMVTIGPFEARYADAYRVAEVRSFEDLQSLGLVPRGLSEQTARDALLSDDRAFRERRGDAAERSACACEDASAAPAARIRRSRIQASLGEALASPSRKSSALDDPGVIHVYHHLARWFDKPARYLVGVIRAQNIFIGWDGILVMSPTVTVVDADVIDIADSGRLKFQASSVNVRCATLNGRFPLPSPGSHGPSPGSTPPYPPPGPWPQLRSTKETAARYLRGYARERRTLPASDQ